jgi:hypothetical protein
MTRANRFDVIGGVSDSELQMLKPRNSSTRVFLVQTWMFRLMTNRLLAGGLGVPPPILSRTYQVLGVALLSTAFCSLPCLGALSMELAVRRS